MIKMEEKIKGIVEDLESFISDSKAKVEKGNNIRAELGNDLTELKDFTSKVYQTRDEKIEAVNKAEEALANVELESKSAMNFDALRDEAKKTADATINEATDKIIIKYQDKLSEVKNGYFAKEQPLENFDIPTNDQKDEIEDSFSKMFDDKVDNELETQFIKANPELVSEFQPEEFVINPEASDETKEESTEEVKEDKKDEDLEVDYTIRDFDLDFDFNSLNNPFEPPVLGDALPPEAQEKVNATIVNFPEEVKSPLNLGDVPVTEMSGVAYSLQNNGIETDEPVKVVSVEPIDSMLKAKEEVEEQAPAQEEVSEPVIQSFEEAALQIEPTEETVPAETPVEATVEEVAPTIELPSEEASVELPASNVELSSGYTQVVDQEPARQRNRRHVS